MYMGSQIQMEGYNSASVLDCLPFGWALEAAFEPIPYNFVFSLVWSTVAPVERTIKLNQKT